MTNNNLKILIDEIKAVIKIIKDKQDTNTAWTGTEKADIEKRINHIYDKSNPRHTNLTQDLQTDLKELIEIEKAIGSERIAQAKKQKELEDKNKQLETDNQTKDQQIKEKEEAIGQKITKELIEKLEKIEPGKIDETKITELKTLLEEVKKQEIKADLTETDKKIEEVGKKVAETKSPTNYWNIIACIFRGLSLLIMVYLVATRDQGSKKSSAEREKDED